MEAYYLWFKSFHLIAVISWMAGMLYLPRIYVYHADSQVNSESDKTFQIMENKLLRFIMNPAMIISLVLGLILAKVYGFRNLGSWFHVKMLGVIILVAFHGLLAKWRKDFANGKNSHSSKFFRLVNEVPTVTLIVIIIMVIVKPFEG